jgi:hypothetical protein
MGAKALTWIQSIERGGGFSHYISPLIVPITNKPMVVVRFRSKRKYLTAIKAVKAK